LQFISFRDEFHIQSDFADDGSVNVHVYVCMHVVGTQYLSHKYQYSPDLPHWTTHHISNKLFLLFTETCSQRLLDPRVVGITWHGS